MPATKPLLDSEFKRLHHSVVEVLLIGSLQINPRNARTHSKRQLGLIKRSIQEFGQIKPVIIDDQNMILAGHGFIEAAKLAGLTHVSALRFSHLTDTQKRAYLLADNRIADQAGWDREILSVELGELVELLPTQGLDVSLTGFEHAEVDLLLAEMVSAPTAEAPLLTLPALAVTVRDDLWLLGKHRLLCGDAQVSANFDRLMLGSSAAATFCDPPYNLKVSGIGGRGRIQHSEFAFGSGEMRPEQFRRFLSKTLANGMRASAEGAVHYVCMDWRHIDDLIAVGRKLYGAMLNLVVWNKSNAGQGSFYRSQHELIGVFRVGESPHKNNVELGRFGRNRSNVWTYPGVNTFGTDRLKTLASHPTVKPTAMVADALLDCTSRGDVVLDQFAGSGTIFLAAEKVGRIAYGMEIDPRYVDVAIKRWQSVTKREATLEGDGRTFEEVSAIRTKPPDEPNKRCKGLAAHPTRRSSANDLQQFVTSGSSTQSARTSTGPEVRRG